MVNRTIAAVVSVLAFVPAGAGAQSYAGKTLNMVVGYPTGGSNDLYARAVARHIGKHLPGNPTVVVRNMPGAGSVLASNHIFNVAPRDGTVIGLVSATIALDEKLGAPGVKYEAPKFTWIGRVASAINVTMTWHGSPVKSMDDAFRREVTLGATGTSSTVFVYPNVLKNVVGARFRIVLGYKGSGEAMLAMERGEVDGHSTSWEAVKALHQDWIDQKKIAIIVQYGRERHPDLPDVPTAVELARSPEEAQVLRAVVNATDIGKAVLAPPGLSPELTQMLRRAFDATMKDKEFADELEKTRSELSPMTGEQLQGVVEEFRDLPPSVVEKIKAVYGTP